MSVFVRAVEISVDDGVIIAGSLVRVLIDRATSGRRRRKAQSAHILSLRICAWIYAREIIFFFCYCS